MNTIQSNVQPDTWNRFLKLTEDARNRNQGISTAKTNIAKVNTTSKPDINQLINEKKAIFNRSITFNSSVPKTESKILGGLFDTYV